MDKQLSYETLLLMLEAMANFFKDIRKTKATFHVEAAGGEMPICTGFIEGNPVLGPDGSENGTFWNTWGIAEGTRNGFTRQAIPILEETPGIGRKVEVIR